jgi:two-component system response regulator AlgR
MKILIADDEAPARERLRAMLTEIPGADEVIEARDGREAVQMAESEQVDTVLLDIAMPALDGLEAARHLATFVEPPAVIFCTAHDDHALEAFEASAVDYLVKPVRRERLVAALERARKLTGERVRTLSEHLPQRKRTHICARVRGSLKLVPIADVVYFLAEDKYVVVHHVGGELLVEESLKSLEEEFGDQFARIHRNCLVAVERIVGLRRSADGRALAEVRGSPEPLEVSRRNLPSLRHLVKQL